jgi:F0F1-type ATP synthase gamma subunit
LCGALHTTICREILADMNASSAAEKKLVTIGDKGRVFFAGTVSIKNLGSLSTKNRVTDRFLFLSSKSRQVL